MSGVLIRTALLLFVPLIIAFFTSEFLGVDKKYTNSDALLQALAEVFRAPTAGRIVLAILWVCTLGISTFYWRQWVDDQMAPMTIQVPKPDDPTRMRTVVCSADELKGRNFAGLSPQGHVRLRINRVDGADVAYSLVRGERFQMDGSGAFDRSNCTLIVNELGSRARIYRDGRRYSLVAVDPLWTLDYYEAR